MEKSVYASISKTKTFAPPTIDREYLFAHLLRNPESACIKARRYNLAPRRITVFLKKQNFDSTGCEATLLYSETRRKHLGISLFQADFPPANASD